MIIEMLGTWKGSYRYDNEIVQKAVGHDQTNFTIEIESFELDTFTGKVTEDLSTGGMKGVGEVSGEIAGDGIYFEKQMPFSCILLDEFGNRKESDKKHPLLFCEGLLVASNKYSGTWKFDQK